MLFLKSKRRVLRVYKEDTVPRMSIRGWQFFLGVGLASLLAVLALESWTDMDMALQRLWFNRESGEWLITRLDFQATRWLWYGGAKKTVSIIGGVCVAVFAASFFVRKLVLWRKCCLLLALSLALVPALAGMGKIVTDIYCPRELMEFGGEQAYQRVLEWRLPVNEAAEGGRCFPAGYASGGFALIMLYFAVPSARWRWVGLATGLTAGWLMGGYQMLRGEHFLSHTVTTMLLAWLVDLLIILIVERFRDRIGLTGPPRLLP